MEQSMALTRKDLNTFLVNWDQRQQVASMLIKSGFLPPAYREPSQVIATMLLAHELGIPEMEAIRGINVIQGKPTVSPQLMLALINRSGQLEDMHIDNKDGVCSVTMKRRGRTAVTAVFSMDDAKAMGLAGKDNWVKQAKTMMQWRAISACARLVFPDIISGMYTTEELDPDARLTEDGETISPSIGAMLPPLPEHPVEVVQSETQQGQPVRVQNQTVGTEFDPTKEEMGFGKFKGHKWAEADKSYIEWLAGSATKADIKAKAEATLRFFGQIPVKEQPSIVDEMFPPGTVDKGTGEIKTISDEIKKKSAQHTVNAKEAIRTAKTQKTLVDITKRIETLVNGGELIEADANELIDLVDKRGEEMKGAKK